MTADSKAKDHWFQMYAIRNRVDAGIIMNIYVIVIVRLKGRLYPNRERLQCSEEGADCSCIHSFSSVCPLLENVSRPCAITHIP